MTKGFRRRASVKESIFQKSSERDKSQINTFALFVPLSAIVAGISFGFCVYYIGDTLVGGIVVGCPIAYGLYNHDKTLLEEFSQTVLSVRIFFSVLAIAFLTIPIKAFLNEDQLITQIESEIEEYNASIRTDIEFAKSDIYSKEAELHAKVTEAGKTFSRGKSQALVEARRERDAFLETKDERLQAIEDNYAPKFKFADTSNIMICGAFFNNMFQSSKPADMFLNIVIFLLFIAFESAPALIRLSLEGGTYLTKKQHENKLLRKADSEMQDLQEELVDSIGSGNEIELLTKFEIFNAFRNEVEAGFQNSESIVSLAQKAKSLNEPPPQQLKAATPKAKQLNNRQPKQEFPEFQYIKKQ